METTKGRARVPSPYSHLLFSSFDIFNLTDLTNAKFLSLNDYNCAVSSPNTLIGSRSAGEGSSPASIQIADAASMALNGLYPYFTLVSFYIKPMDSPPPEKKVYVRGHTYAQKEPFLWEVEFPYGYHLPFLVKVEEYSGKPWEQLYKVEVAADFGPDALDWEFCIDNLEVQFIRKPQEEWFSPSQVVLGD